MKICLYGADRRLGLIQGERVLNLEEAAKSASSEREKTEPFGSLLALIETGDRGLDLCSSLADRYSGSDDPSLWNPLAKATLHAPFPGRRLAAAGNNFAQHVANAFNNFGKTTTAAEIFENGRKGPAGGFWVISEPVGPEAQIPEPCDSEGLFDYEGELGVILGTGGKGLSADRWAEQIWGTTLFVDWSLRKHDIFANQRPFYGHKNFDASMSMGPWISVGELDPFDCTIETFINDERRQCFTTKDMIYSFSEIFEQLSRNLTLLPGDVLASGTGPGTAADMSVPGDDKRLPLDLFLKPGDRVEVRSMGLGSLGATVCESR